ncbi:MAG: conjugal transfer protein TraN, partial [Alphaproteobacteria bacterium]
TMKPNGEMSEALSQLMVLNEAQKDIRQEGENVKIFKGQNRRCRKAWNGARDCCGSGNRWAVSWKMAPGCDVQEKELGDWRAKRRCVEVGTYCAQKLPIIGCIEKKPPFVVLAPSFPGSSKNRAEPNWGLAGVIQNLRSVVV